MSNMFEKLRKRRLLIFILLATIALPAGFLPTFGLAAPGDGFNAVNKDISSGVSEELPNSAIQAAPFFVQDEFTDVRDNGDGTKTYHIYQAPRSIYEEDGVKKVRPDDWSEFDSDSKSKLKRGLRGYAYAIPFEDEEIIVSIGEYQKGKDRIIARPTDFEQSKNGNRIITKYTNVYPDVDVEFSDFSNIRQRKIIIKENPGLKDGEDAIYWEEIRLPKGAQVFTGTGTRITRNTTIGYEPIEIRLKNGEMIRVSPGIVFDSKSSDLSEIEMTAQAVDQKIEFNRKENKLRIGLVVNAEYLNDPDRVYPVIVDPDICRGSCFIVDRFYRTNSNTRLNPPYIDSNPSYYDSGRYIDDLFVGNYYDPNYYNWHGRHAFIRFYKDFVNGLTGTVTNARLILHYRSGGLGKDTSAEIIAKRVTSDITSDFTYFEKDTSLTSSISNYLTTDGNSSQSIWESTSEKDVSLDVTNTVSNWHNGVTNNGLMVEGVPTWITDSTPDSDWDDLLLIFHSYNNPSGKGPYLAITTQDNRPNLNKFSHFVNPTSVEKGQTVLGTVVVQNNGNSSTTRNSQLRFAFNNNSSYSESGFVFSKTIPPLTTTQKATISFSYTVPASATTGVHFLNYFIDGLNEIDEIVEGLENKGSMQVVVTDIAPTLEPNLINGSCSVTPDEVEPSAFYRLDCSVVNVGGSTAGSSTVRYYLSNDTNRDNSDSTLASSAVGSLSPGQSSFKSHNVRRESFETSGSYYVLFSVDDNEVVAESNNFDNITAVPVTFIDTPPPPGPPDADGDGYSDLEEMFVGTDPNSADSKPVFDITSVNYSTLVGDQNQDNTGGDPVNTRTGAFEFNLTDFTLESLVTPIVASRTYNSKMAERGGKFGNGWTGSYDIYYYQDSVTKNVQLYKGGSAISSFTTSDGGNTFTASSGETGVLYLDAGTLIYKTQDNTKYIFSKQISDNIGALKQIEDIHGNVLNLFYKSINGVETLYRIVEPGSQRIDYAFWPATGKVSQVEMTGVSPRPKVIFEYDASGNLIKQTERRTYGTEAMEEIVREFSYDASGLMTTYTDPRGTILYNDYDGEGRVVRQYEHNPEIDAVDTKRQVYAFEYQGASIKAPGSTHCTKVTNYRSATATYSDTSCFDASEIKIYQEDGLGNFERWVHDLNGMITNFTNKNGDSMSFVYNSDRFLITEIFPDANGYHTEIDYTYWGALNSLTDVTETVTKPADPGFSSSRTTHFEINPANGDVLYIRYPDNKKEYFGYDSFGRLLFSNNRNGVITNYAYFSDEINPSSTKVSVTFESGVYDLLTNYLYDGHGNVTQIMTPDADVYRNEYDNHGNLRKSIDPYLNVETFTYDHENHLISQTDKLGHVTNFDYNTDIEATLKRVHTVNGGETTETRFEYDYVGNLVKTIDPLLNQETYWYDDANRLQSETTGGRTVEYGYDRVGNLLSQEVAGTGRRTEHTFDPRGNNLTTKFVLDGVNDLVYIYGYDEFGQQTTITNPNGDTATFVYDVAGNVISRTDVDGETTTFTYDANGNKLSVLYPRAQTDLTLRNVNGHSETYEYNEIGWLIDTTNADDKVTHNIYDFNGDITSITDRRNIDGTSAAHSVVLGYDKLGNLIETRDSYESTSNFTYDAMGQLLTEVDAAGRTTTYEYDDIGNILKTIDPDGNETVMTYDKNGNQTSVTAADGVRLSYQYDSFDRIKKEIDNVGNETVYTFDAAGNLWKETDRRGNTKIFEYDNLNRIQTERHPNGSTTTYAYDKTNNILSSTITENASGKTRTTAFTYDQLGRALTVTNLEGDTETLTYDADGNVRTRTDGENQTTTYTYDALGRRVLKVRADGQSVNYVFDAWDNLRVIADSTGSTTYTYDNENRLINEDKTLSDLGRSYSITRTYNPDGSLQSLTDASGKKIDYTYNTLGQLDLVKDGATILADYDYNVGGLSSRTSYGNGVTTNYGYDSLNRVNDITINDSSATELFKHDYTYDAEDNRTSLIENGARTINYAYDNLEQLTGVDYTNVGAGDDITFTYDAFGNRTTSATPFGDVGYTIDNNSDQLLNYRIDNRESIGMVYDANGSLTQESKYRLGQAVQTVDYTWDAENRLSTISYTQNDSSIFISSIPENHMSFKYDDFGNRIKKSVNGKDSYYINDGLTVLNELDAVGDVSKIVVAGAGQVAEFDELGNILYTHQDVLGSTILTTNESGEVVDIFEYDVYGQILGLSVEAGTNTLFTGQEFDAESELYYYNARYYNPRLGRFISRDSRIGGTRDVLSRNRYTYVKNNPLKYIDPTGHGEKSCGTIMSCEIYQFTNIVGGISTGIGILSYINSPLPGGNTWSLYPSKSWLKENPNRKSTTAIHIYNDQNKGARLDIHKAPGNNKTKIWHYNTDPQTRFTSEIKDPHLSAGKAGIITGKAASAVKVMSRGTIVVGLAVDAYSIYDAEDPYRETAKVAGGWAGASAGGWVGATTGATAGAAVGALFGGVGAAPGALIGGFVGGLAGSIGGYFGGSKAGGVIYDQF